VAVPIADVLGFHRGLARTAEAAAHRGGNGGSGYDGNRDDPHDGDDGKVDGGGSLECDYLLPFRWNNSPPLSLSSSSSYGGSLPTTNVGGGKCMKIFPAHLMNKLFCLHAFWLGFSFQGGVTTTETGGGAASATAATGRINILSFVNDNAASGGGGRLPHTLLMRGQ
jgi:hypothetical protein